MRKSYLSLLAAFLASSLQAQSRTEKKVTATIELLKQALVSGSRWALNDIVADQLSYGHSLVK